MCANIYRDAYLKQFVVKARDAYLKQLLAGAKAAYARWREARRAASGPRAAV